MAEKTEWACPIDGMRVADCGLLSPDPVRGGSAPPAGGGGAITRYTAGMLR
jgi:hypothetical protein